MDYFFGKGVSNFYGMILNPSGVAFTLIHILSIFILIEILPDEVGELHSILHIFSRDLFDN
jgi:hypothetical protein